MLPFRAKTDEVSVPLAHDGSGMFEAKRLFLAPTSCVKVLEASLRL